jgi:hypothetical protein
VDVNITELRRAVARQLSDVPGLRVYAYQIDQIPAGEADVAVVDIADDAIDYHQAYRGGLAFVHLIVELSVQMSSERAASERMDALLSAGSGEVRSVIDALYADRTLGGLTGGFVVTSTTRPYSSDEPQRRLNSSLTLRIPVGRQ